MNMVEINNRLTRIEGLLLKNAIPAEMAELSKDTDHMARLILSGRSAEVKAAQKEKMRMSL